ncbi:hypothetical protein PVIIG_06067 [Plasmodium vivax India VII]|uniref:Uncharacterized protein n=1 Tax=Plasmodium vivax India VII TaxID=1077284 RepID=A0A0J9S306_PLAVI|nr:hypothetical protein PVIIG_06067 [Plasmodium vivax India VII]
MSYTTKYNFVSSCKVLREEIQGCCQERTSMYDVSCDDFKRQYEPYIDYNNKYTCQQVMYILNSISSQAPSLYNDNRCKYLYYWIYQDLLQKNNNYDIALKWYRIFLNSYFEVDDDNHICNNYVHESKGIILKRSAKLIELYDTINNNDKPFNCDCAKICSELYTEYVKECDNNYDPDYCSELQNFKYIYEANIKSIVHIIFLNNSLLQLDHE